MWSPLPPQLRVLITLDQGMGDIRAYPPGSHAGIVVLRLPDQSAAAVTQAITDLASFAEPTTLAGAIMQYARSFPIVCARGSSDFGSHYGERSGGRWARPPRMASMVMPSFAA
jgi:hypothetical protein